MAFQLVEKQFDPDGESRVWDPFPDNEDFNPSWWSEPFDRNGPDKLLEAYEDGIEVARIRLGSKVATGHYLNTPGLGDAALGIHFIEVAASHRGRGIGTKVVEALVARYGDRRLLAFSEGADGFWASLGWTRFDHPERASFYRPLFVQPGPLDT